MPAEASEPAPASVSSEELELAVANLKEGKSLIDDDPEKAVELLCSVVRTYEKKYGSEGIECADVYLYYGIALYEVARNATDALGTTKTTVDKKEQAEDDMKLAWEMIELSRIIYDRNSPEQHHSKLAEVHKSLGDIKSEEERFEEAAECYRQSIAHLKAMQPPSKRRIAEVQYKLSLSLTFMEQPDQALAQTEEAIGSLEAAAGEIEEKLAALPTDGSGGEEAEEEGRRLQETADDLRAVMTELTHNCEGLRDTIKHNNSLKEALSPGLAASGQGASVVGATAAGTADGQAQAQEPAKRARLEEAAAAPSEAPSSDAAK
eukprot:XP_001695316.1 predicted protein [Chlamydomonas reinhardtii]